MENYKHYHTYMILIYDISTLLQDLVPGLISEFILRVSIDFSAKGTKIYNLRNSRQLKLLYRFCLMENFWGLKPPPTPKLKELRFLSDIDLLTWSLIGLDIASKSRH